MIPIDCKITNIPLYLHDVAFENIYILLYYITLLLIGERKDKSLITSLAGCRTWCPTDLQHLCCKALINK